MSFMESNWLNECPPDFKPMYYRRYVDDSFLLFKSEDQISHFQNYRNNKQPNIKLTCERENNCNLDFVDCLVTRKNNKFESISTHRKETFSGLSSSYFSFTPFIHKLYCLGTSIYRGYNISSRYFAMHSAFEFLRYRFYNI